MKKSGIEAERHGRVVDQQRKRPFRIGPFLDRRPHQRDAGRPTHHVDRARRRRNRAAVRSEPDRARRRGTPDSRRGGRCRNCQIAIPKQTAMPTADSGIVRRDSMPAAMPSWSAPISVESVLSSGVRRIPPTAQIAMKKKPQSGAEHQFGIVADEAGGAIQRAQHGSPQRWCLRPGSRSSGRESTARTGTRNPGKARFPGRAAGRDVEGAEPFDVRAARCRPGALTTNASGIAAATATAYAVSLISIAYLTARNASPT